MNPELHRLLTDLARYLDQQHERGVVAFRAVEPADAPAGESADAPSDAPAAPDPELVPAPAPREAAAPVEAAPAPDADDPFARECAAFVRASLAKIAAFRGGPATAPAPPSQGAIFADPGASAADAGAGDDPGDPAAREAALAALADEVRACTRCALHAGRNLAVPGEGDPRASLVLVGEAPGADEDRQGRPFVGKSGQLLTRMLAAIDFAREDVFICNILKCRPPGNRDPQADEVVACRGYLERQLRLIRPRLVLCLGRVAAQTLLGTSEPLGRLRREVRMSGGIPVMATYHPAALLRNPANKRPAWDDLRRLRALHDALAGQA
jgi:DNA polymerase